jgi:hypothetical protein
VYRCRQCHRVDNVYTGTIQGNQRRPAKVILPVRDVCKGKPSTVLAKELGISRTTVHTLRRAMQHSAHPRQSAPPDNQHTETDEMFQHAGETRSEAPTRPIHHDGGPTGGGGTEQESTTVRRLWVRWAGRAGRYGDGWCSAPAAPFWRPTLLALPVCRRPSVPMNGEAMRSVHGCIIPSTTATVWARDDDGDGKHEVHVNTCEGLWTKVRNFLRPFRGVHKTYLAVSVAICEVRINEKRIAPGCITQLVRMHYF